MKITIQVISDMHVGRMDVVYLVIVVLVTLVG